jgi:hypothetical protein
MMARAQNGIRKTQIAIERVATFSEVLVCPISELHTLKNEPTKVKHNEFGTLYTKQGVKLRL